MEHENITLDYMLKLGKILDPKSELQLVRWGDEMSFSYGPTEDFYLVSPKIELADSSVYFQANIGFSRDFNDRAKLSPFDKLTGSYTVTDGLIHQYVTHGESIARLSYQIDARTNSASFVSCLSDNLSVLCRNTKTLLRVEKYHLGEYQPAELATVLHSIDASLEDD